MGIRVEVGVGPLRWSRPIRLPRAGRNALTLVGSLTYVVVLALLWIACALAVWYESAWAGAMFAALGLALGSGVWWLGRQAWRQWRPGWQQVSRSPERRYAGRIR